jgi:hypothetical protein
LSIPAAIPRGFGKSSPKRFIGSSGELYKFPSSDVRRRERLVFANVDIKRL